MGNLGMTKAAAASRAEMGFLLTGTFLICAALLAFEVSTVRTINFAIGPSYIFVSIALAMLGLTTAGSVLSLFDLSKAKHRRAAILALLCLAIAILLLFAHVAVANAKDSLNDAIRDSGVSHGLDGVVRANLVQGPFHAVRIGLVLTLPYFLFGALLSFLFATSEPQEYAKLYAADLIGAAMGCVFIVVVMEWCSYAMSVTLPSAAALAAAAFFANRAWRSLLFIALVLLVGSVLLPFSESYQALIEPKADPNYLVRDYRHQTEQSERWTGWNSFTRIAAIEETNRPGEGAVLSLANGDGMAFLLANGEADEPPRTHPPVIPALIAGVPESALIIFAGAGADMMSLVDHGSQRVTGVELNGRLVEAGLALPGYGLAEFLNDEDVSLHVTEARSFLEQDDEHHDMVMVSWSGATAIYYFGALGGTTQYIFTYQGLSALLNRLSPEGTALILQVNKFDMLHGLRRYMHENSLPNPDRAAIVLYHQDFNNRWDAAWDDNPLLIKVSGWSDAEIEAIQTRARQYGFDIAYAPGLPTPMQFRPYEVLMLAEDPSLAIEEMSKLTKKRLGILPDDRPFVLDHFDPARYFTRDFWRLNVTGTEAFEDTFHLMRVAFTLAVGVLAFILAIAPLALKGARRVSRRRGTVYLGYFLLLGAGFMFVEIGLIQKASILFGNPGLTIAIVLGLVILSTGIGSLASEWCFARALTIRKAALLISVYAVLVAWLGQDLIASVMGASLSIRLAATALLIIPGGLVMGQLFPQGLACAGSEDATLVPWAWAINGAMSAAVAGIAPLVAQATGFQALFLIGAFLYALVMLLPVAPRGA